MGCCFLSNKTMRYQGQVSNCQPPDVKSEALTLHLFNGKNIRSDLEKNLQQKNAAPSHYKINASANTSASVCAQK